METTQPRTKKKLELQPKTQNEQLSKKNSSDWYN